MNLPENFRRDEEAVSARKLNLLVDTAGNAILGAGLNRGERYQTKRYWHPWRVIEAPDSTPSARTYGIRKQDCQIRILGSDTDNEFPSDVFSGYLDETNTTGTALESGDIVYIEVTQDELGAFEVELKLGSKWSGFPAKEEYTTLDPGTTPSQYVSTYREVIAWVVEADSDKQGYVIGGVKIVNSYITPFQVAKVVRNGLISFILMPCAANYDE